MSKYTKVVEKEENPNTFLWYLLPALSALEQPRRIRILVASEEIMT
jgi:hypothetical protein